VHRARGRDGERLGLIHRDLSPSNVLVGFDGSIKLCDFGIAIAAGKRRARPERIEGKAAYMAPEQALGEPFNRRADIYGAGVLAWELLGGRRMRRAASREELLELAAEGRVPALPLHGLVDEPRLHRILRRALARKPRSRYRTATAMRRALLRYCQRHDLRASSQAIAAWMEQHFADERARRRACFHSVDGAVEEPTASGIRRIARRLRATSPGSLWKLALRAFVGGSALLWLLDGLGAW
jgi:serine/threonine-protein kinase